VPSAASLQILSEGQQKHYQDRVEKRPGKMSESYARSFLASPVSEPATINTTISALILQKHIEGGYFVETDRAKFTIPNPFLHDAVSNLATLKEQSPTRQASTTIFYLISPGSPVGYFHRNKGRTIHTLHWGRGRYVVIHADEISGPGTSEKARIETFTVGHDVAKGEKLQWIVEGGKFKASFLLPDVGEEESGKGCLISETVIPGFEYADHDFMTAEELKRLVKEEQFAELAWLLRKGERPTVEELL
jgi:predicted cupin superfamily sugar epimerase